jgi:signal recognition particle receptor subunit beta
MAIIDPKRGVIVIRIVYDGPPDAGKTTTIQALAKSFGKDNIYSPQESSGQTLHFDWMEYSGGFFKGYGICSQIITVPGQLAGHEYRRFLLTLADAVIFVLNANHNADHQTTLAYFQELQQLLSQSAEPLVKTIIQANQQDKIGALSSEQVNQVLFHDYRDIKIIESSALLGKGIREPFVLGVRHALERAAVLLEKKQLAYGAADINSGEELWSRIQQVTASTEPTLTKTTTIEFSKPVIEISNNCGGEAINLVTNQPIDIVAKSDMLLTEVPLSDEESSGLPLDEELPIDEELETEFSIADEELPLTDEVLDANETLHEELPLANEQLLKETLALTDDELIATTVTVSTSEVTSEQLPLLEEHPFSDEELLATGEEPSFPEDFSTNIELVTEEELPLTDEESIPSITQLNETEFELVEDSESELTVPPLVETNLVEDELTLSSQLEDFTPELPELVESQSVTKSAEITPTAFTTIPAEIIATEFTTINQYLPRFTAENTNQIWPPLAGRQLLKELFQHPLNSPLQTEDTWLINVQGWRCYSKTHWLYPTPNQAQQALREHIQRHLHCSPILSEKRCVAITAEDEEHWRLWQIVPMATTLDDYLTKVWKQPTTEQLAIEIFRCTSYYADAYLQCSNYPPLLNLNLTNIGRDDSGQIVYLGYLDNQSVKPDQAALKETLEQVFTKPIAKAIPHLKVTAIVDELKKIDGIEQQYLLDILIQLFQLDNPSLLKGKNQ